MIADRAPNRIPLLRRRVVWFCVLALLGIYAAITFSVALQKGLSFDEGEEIAVGYDIWLRKDFRMEAANGDLVKRWATLPLLISRPSFPGTNDYFWRRGAPYRLAFEFCFEQGNPLDAILLQTRAMTMLIGVATGFLVFFCSRELFGDVGGLISLGLFVFNPHMLAFGAIVSTELSIFLALLGSTWCIWRLLHRVTWGRLALSLVFFGLLLLAKPSALVIFPITAILIAAKLVSGRPLFWHLGWRRIIRSRAGQIGVFSALVAVHAAAGLGAIWSHYDFRYAASPNPSDPGITFLRLPDIDPVDPSVSSFITWSRRSHLLPEGYLHGIERLLRHNESRAAFMDGKWKIGGWRVFFLRCIVEKSSPAFLLLIPLGIAGWGWSRRKGSLSGASRPPPLYEIVPWATLVVVYFGIAVLQDLDIGHRHVLPIYPPLFVLAGSVALLIPVAARWILALPAILILAYAVDSLAVYPDFLAYFSPLAGGPSQGYKHLVDSSLDWGMNLPPLKRWLDRHNPDHREPVFLAYFGTDSPKYRHIDCQLLPSFFDWRPPLKVYFLTPGIYAISATIFQSIYTNPLGPWSTAYEEAYQNAIRNLAVFDSTARDPKSRAALLKNYPVNFWDREYADFERLRFGRLCAWLRHHGPPSDNIGHAILIWRLGADDIQNALFGPPAEIDDHFLPAR